MSSLPTPICSPLSAHTHESTMDSLLELPAPLQRQRTRSEGTIGISGYGHSSYSYSPELYPDTFASSHYKSSVRLQVPTQSSTWHHPSSYKGVEYHSPLYDRMLTPVSATPFDSSVLTGRPNHSDMSAITSPYTSSYSAAPSAEPESYSFVESTSYGNGHYNASMDPIMMQSGMTSSHIGSSHRNDGLDYFQVNRDHDHSHSTYNGVIGL